jgi:hypothetical protein
VELTGTFDLIVSNPPYVGDDDAGLEAVVREWEPHSASSAEATVSTQTRAIAAGRDCVAALRAARSCSRSRPHGRRGGAAARTLGYVDVRVDATSPARPVAQAKRAAT